MVRKNIEIKKIAKEYAVELQKNGIRVKEIILYGSYAHGKPHLGSDIDLIVISSDLAKFHPLKKLEFLSIISGNIDAPIEALGYTPKEIREKGKDSAFWDIIKKTGKTIYQK